MLPLLLPVYVLMGWSVYKATHETFLHHCYESVVLCLALPDMLALSQQTPNVAKILAHQLAEKSVLCYHKECAGACLNAVDDRLDVISLRIQLGLSNFLGPCCNAAADVSNGLRPHRYGLQSRTKSLRHSDIGIPSRNRHLDCTYWLVHRLLNLASD